MINDHNSIDLASQILAHLTDLAKVTPDSSNWQNIINIAIHKTQELKQQLPTLAESEVKWRSLVENSSDIIFIEDGQTNILYTNPVVEQILGYKPESVISGSVLDFIHPDDVTSAQKEWQQLASQPLGATSCLEYRYRHQDGSWRILQSWGKNLLDDPSVKGMVFHCRDITESKLAKGTLQATNDQLQAVLDAVPGFVSWVSAEGHYLGVNRYLAAAFNLSPEEFIGQEIGFRKSSSQYSRFIAEFMNSSKTGASKTIQAQIDGTNRHYLIAAQKYQQGKAAVSVGINITARKKAEEERDHLFVQIEQQNQNLEAQVEQRTAELEKELAERKRAEVALRESEQKLELFFSQSLDGFSFMMLDEPVRWDDTVDKEAALDYVFEHMRFTKINDAMLAQYGAKPGQLNGLTLKELLGHDLERSREIARRCFEAGNLQVEAQELKLNGTPMWTESKIICMYDQEGRITGNFCIQREITDRKQAEVALTESEEKFRQLAENTESAFWITEPDTRKAIYVSPAFEKIWGRQRSSIYNSIQTWQAAIHPEDRERVVALTSQQMHSGSDEQYRIIRPNGEVRWVRDRAFPICNEQGQVYRLAGIAEDITERKEAAEALSRSEERFRSLVETSSDFVWELSKNLLFTYASPQVSSIWGYQPEELLGKSPFDLMSNQEAERVKGLLETFFRAKKPFQCIENACIHKKGHLVVMETSGVPIFDSANQFQGYRGMDRDITERKLAEDKIKASLQEKETLLKEIHHRVKNNLQIISSLLRLQSRHIEDRQTMDLVSESQNRVRSMALVHEQLYQSSNLAEVDLQKYIRNLTSNLLRSYSINSCQIHLTINVEPIALGVDLAIPCGLIINELISNCLKYAFSGRRKGEIRVSLHSSEKNSFILAIKDDGVGLPDNLDLHTTNTLGLQLVRRLTKQLGGIVELNRHQGTEFKIIAQRP